MVEGDQLNLNEIYKFALEVAENAGQMLVKASQNRDTYRDDNIRLKKNTVDIVTETDEKVEQFIKLEINKRYPNHKFIGEETYSSGQSKKYLVDDDPTWIVDPLDGTVNYVHLFPMMCVSIGFVVGGRAVIGVVNAPFLNQTYSAYQGGGAWLNQRTKLPLQKLPLPEDAPRGCIFLCEWGKDRKYSPGLNLQRKVDSFVNMATDYCHGIRSLGSASLDLCFVASGAFDIWWEGGCWEWDVAGAVAILNEAQGLITTGNKPETDEIPEVELGSRLYLAIRPCEETEKESARESQERVVRQVWDRVHKLDYERPQ